ncbi:hypothetical protein F610DRAFT_06966 [Streptomyces sp. LaPpAH-199]|uniref:hypothetical protein n=1 Tax=Streptomyces TaxID=1883 RepID=UPI000883A66C|nr:hypothetical protein [Streptomyces sp. LaPpAH-199]MYW76745.1 hypothetical protein [Streptomyces sp. SID8369]SDE38584.1 hypothetical protein F610DRAFT_06966 [Streptomyces sp. LaPpAH-199]
MTTHQFDGHRFDTQVVLKDAEDGPEAVGLAAKCSCGWRGGDGDPGMEGKGGFAGPFCHPVSLTEDGEAEAEQAAEQEWLEDHIAGGAVVPAALADQIRSVGEQLDAMIEADEPMAVLAAIRLSGGYFARQARDAAMRASYLDHSWSQIGEALGISKQAAWERYGKSRPEKVS